MNESFERTDPADPAGQPPSTDTTTTKESAARKAVGRLIWRVWDVITGIPAAICATLMVAIAAVVLVSIVTIVIGGFLSLVLAVVGILLALVLLAAAVLYAAIAFLMIPGAGFLVCTLLSGELYKGLKRVAERASR